MATIHRAGLCVLVSLCICARADALSLVVTSDADSGPGTLREAITLINAVAVVEDHLITFAESVEFIVLASPLPPIDRDVTIEGEGRVTLVGTELATGDGLRINGPGNFIRGLTIVGFPDNGIHIDGSTSAGAPNNAVSNCRIGTTGTIAVGNGGAGIYFNRVDSAFIGRALPGERNVISGNVGAGILLRDSGNVRVRNCLIGTNAEGTAAIPNDFGVIIERNVAVSANHRLGEAGPFAGNVISGNNLGVLIFQSNNIKVDGNLIGTTADGATALGNANAGLVVVAGERLDMGGEARNVVAGSAGSGISVVSGEDHVIRGNYIGTNAAGTANLPNSIGGINISGGIKLRIGGTQPGEGNLFSGNFAAGLSVNMIDPVTPADIVIQGNRFGVQAASDTPLSLVPQGAGVVVTAGTGILIGGDEEGASNLFAHNDFGIALEPGAQRVAIRRNSIHSNTIRGILNMDGANAGVQPPVIVLADPIVGATIPNGAVDIFADAGGQGRHLLGTTQANVVGEFSLPNIDLEPYEGMQLTATVTDAQGNTSEFSAPFPLGDPAPATHTADSNGDGAVNLSELLRVIQFYNSGNLHCQPGTEDGYAPGPGDQTCAPHASDYNPQDWTITLTELLRLIQFYNAGAYHPCPGEGTEDGYCVGPPPA